MNLWKLEWLRLLRTRRLLVLLAVFVIFGFLGPLFAKYLPEIIGNSAGNNSGLKITFTRAPVPADGFAEYMSNVLQLGLLAVVIVAANSLAIDAKSSLSVFYRTRVAKTADLLFPRFTVITLATLAAFAAGTLTAWYEAVVLLGHVPVHDVIVGGLYICVYWVFCIATVALASSLVRGLLGTAGLSLAILFLSPIIGSIKSLSQWLPSTLAGSMNALLVNQHAAAYYFKSAATAAAAIAVFLAIALARLKTREIES